MPHRQSDRSMCCLLSPMISRPMPFPATGTPSAKHQILTLWLLAVRDSLVPIVRGPTAALVVLLSCLVIIRMRLAFLVTRTPVHKLVTGQCGLSISKITGTMPRGSVKSFIWECLVGSSKVEMDRIVMVEMGPMMLNHGTKDSTA